MPAVELTGFDVERILRREGAPKAFAKAVAAACRAAGLFDRSQSDKELLIEEMKVDLSRIASILRG